MSGLGGHTLALEEEQVARELLPSDAVVRCGVTNIFLCIKIFLNFYCLNCVNITLPLLHLGMSGS